MSGNTATNIEKFGLGSRLETRTMQHPWLAFTEWDALNVLSVIKLDEPINFAFTQSLKLQAGANTLHRQILVTGGFGDMMCRLCSAIVSAGVFAVFGNPSASWTPVFDPTSPVENVLKDDFFDWENGNIPWRGDEEREPLFLFLLLQTHRFVLLHEAAHIIHKHDGNKQTGLGSIIDGAVTEAEQDEAVAAEQMARELVADADAFHEHFDIMAREFAGESDDRLSKLMRAKLIGTPRERLRMTLLSAFLVFQILDYREWSIEDACRRSHPPAPFRMKALYATALELKRPGLSREEIVEEIESAKFLGSVVVDVGLNRLPALGWLDQVQGCEWDELFSRIYANMHKWSDPSRMVSA